MLNDFRSHPKRRANKRVALRFYIGQLCCDTKVRELNLARRREKNVCGFDVPMNLSFAVEVVKTEEQLPANNGNVRFVERAGFELEQVS
jgi:hypothetical protein